MRKFYSLLFTISLATSVSSYAQMTLQGNRTAQQLAEKLAGKGVFISNASLQCAQSANGTFRSVNTTLGIDSGIVLTTGQVYQVNGPEPGVISTNNRTAGDRDLTNLTGAPSTNDACVLSFDVVPQGTKLQFDYVFASEEYVNAVCGVFNDGFAFFISGLGITGQYNMAKVPGTNIPVAVNSINNGIVGTYHGSTWRNCTDMGQGAPFTQYYLDNSYNPYIAFNGMTTVLTASADVIPCNTYRLKIAIADAGNALYDSGVFIKAGSMTSNAVEFKSNYSLVDNTAHLIRTCDSGLVSLKRSLDNIAQPLTVTLSYGGDAVAGVDFTTLPSSVTFPSNIAEMPINFATLFGTNTDKTLTIYVEDPNHCGNNTAYADSISFEFTPKPFVAIIPDTLSMCNGATLDIIATLDSQLTYQWSPLNAPNSARNNVYTKSDAREGYVYVTGIHKTTGCVLNTDSVYVAMVDAVSEANIISDLDTIKVCYGQSITLNGSYVGDNSLNTYWISNGDTLSRTSRLNVTANERHNGWLYFWVGNTSCAPAIDSIYIHAVPEAPLPLVNSPVELCLTDSLILSAEGQSLTWYDRQWGSFPLREAPHLFGDQLGVEEYYVTSKFGTCESDKVPILVQKIKCCEQEMFIPNAFTPNSDGLNDVFELRIDGLSRLVIFEVFNRWGNRVYLQQSPYGKWDGTMNGKPLDVGTYIYRVLFQCSNGSQIERKGTIDLVR